MYPILAVAHLYDSFDNCWKDEHYLLYAHSLADATSIVEDYCKDELDSVTLSYLADEGSLITVDATTAQILREHEATIPPTSR